MLQKLYYPIWYEESRSVVEKGLSRFPYKEMFSYLSLSLSLSSVCVCVKAALMYSPSSAGTTCYSQNNRQPKARERPFLSQETKK